MIRVRASRSTVADCATATDIEEMAALSSAMLTANETVQLLAKTLPQGPIGHRDLKCSASDWR